MTAGRVLGSCLFVFDEARVVQEGEEEQKLLAFFPPRGPPRPRGEAGTAARTTASDHAHPAWRSARSRPAPPPQGLVVGSVLARGRRAEEL